MGGTESLLYIKGLPMLLYHFLALSDWIADVLVVDYLITIPKYRLGLCTMALHTPLRLHHFQPWKSIAELGGCQVDIASSAHGFSSFFFRLPLLIFFYSLALDYLPTNYNQNCYH